jgi:hypothetical protein
MDRSELTDLWTGIRADLSRARAVLGSDLAEDATIRWSLDFQEHNELELACDALAEYGEGRPVTAEFWLALRDAAAKMKLSDRVVAYERNAEAAVKR